MRFFVILIESQSKYISVIKVYLSFIIWGWFLYFKRKQSTYIPVSKIYLILIFIILHDVDFCILRNSKYLHLYNLDIINVWFFIYYKGHFLRGN